GRGAAAAAGARAGEAGVAGRAPSRIPLAGAGTPAGAGRAGVPPPASAAAGVPVVSSARVGPSSIRNTARARESRLSRTPSRRAAEAGAWAVGVVEVGAPDAARSGTVPAWAPASSRPGAAAR